MAGESEITPILNFFGVTGGKSAAISAQNHWWPALSGLKALVCGGEPSVGVGEVGLFVMFHVPGHLEDFADYAAIDSGRYSAKKRNFTVRVRISGEADTPELMLDAMVDALRDSCRLLEARAASRRPVLSCGRAVRAVEELTVRMQDGVSLEATGRVGTYRGD